MNILKKQGAAWTITIVMVLLAIFIGIGKGATTPVTPLPPQSTVPPAQNDYFYVYDDANVLSAGDKKALSERNRALADEMEVVIACVTTNYGKSDLYDFALDYAARIELMEYDFIVVLDISGDNYWLVQGAGLQNLFTDDDCGDYTRKYMEDDFARGDYGDALLSLTKALSAWYEDHYVG